MSNLLPTEQQTVIRHEYHSRLVVVSFSLLLATLLISLVSLTPAYILSGDKETEAAKRDRSLKDSPVILEQNDLSEALKLVREQVKLLQSNQKEITLSAFIARVIADRPAGVKVTSFSLGKGVAGETILSIGGQASSRGTLLTFTRRLEKERDVAKLDVPVSNFAKNNDIDFSLTIFLGPAS